MPTGSQRLTICGRGSSGESIWNGGYRIVLEAIRKVIALEYAGLDYEEQIVCPICLEENPIGEADVWELSDFMKKKIDDTIHCEKIHNIGFDKRCLLSGEFDTEEILDTFSHNTRPIDRATMSSVVIIGLWNEGKLIRVGSGFILNGAKGLILTAAHTLMTIDKKSKCTGDGRFGENYHGKKDGKVIVGLIPEEGDGTNAVFRYFAKIVAKDKTMDCKENAVCHIDACLLQLTTRFEVDIESSNVESCGNQVEIPLLNPKKRMKEEGLKSLELLEGSECAELNEKVTIFGFNQEGRGLWSPGMKLNMSFELVNGYVRSKWKDTDEPDKKVQVDTYCPKVETVIRCRSLSGQSGGPCVNSAGKVIGIVCRDVREHDDCYLVPNSELVKLVETYKKDKKRERKLKKRGSMRF